MSVAELKPNDGNLRFPVDYRPYPTLCIASNVLENVQALVEVDGVAPLLVGRGTVPLIWLWAYIDQQWTLIVERSVSKHPNVKVTVGDDGEVFVYAGNTPILRAVQQNEETAHLPFLDLRPVGLSIYTDKDVLNVAGNALSGNRFSDLPAAVSLE